MNIQASVENSQMDIDNSIQDEMNVNCNIDTIAECNNLENSLQSEIFEFSEMDANNSIEDDISLILEENVEFDGEKISECNNQDISTLQSKIRELETKNLKLAQCLSNVRKSNLEYRKKLVSAINKATELQKLLDKNQFYAALHKIFEQDQIDKLIGLKKRVNWSSNTYVKAIKLKYACGTSGYEELLNSGFPLPCTRAISKQLESLKLSHGICNESFDFMKLKVDSKDPLFDVDSGLIIDEMNMTSVKDAYDPSSCRFIGNVTLGPDKSEVADNALVFMLVGLKAKWKQVVGLHFTSKQMTGLELKPEILKMIRKAESIGLRVHNVTSDMSGPNQGLWSAFNIFVKPWSNSNIYNSIAHPCDDSRKLYFTPDVPHALKCIKTSLLNNKIIKVHKDHVLEFNLPSDTVKSKHLINVVDADDEDELKLSPKLNRKILEKSHFQKMRVNNSVYTFYLATSSSLEFLTNENPDDERLTTVWFMQFIEKWFNIMSNRKICLALSLKNFDKYIETISFLIKAIDIFSKLKVGDAGIWKPFQTSVLLSTKTVLDLSSYLLLDRGYDFFFTSRLTQDCLENLFSLIRLRNVVPNAVQVQNYLKLIMVSRFTKYVKSSNYADGELAFVSNFFELLKKNKKSYNSVSRSLGLYQDCDILPAFSSITFDYKLINTIYYDAGYTIKTIIDNQKVCDKCINTVGRYEPYTFNGTLLTRIRAKVMSNLIFVHEEIFDFFLKMEYIFRAYYDNARKNDKVNLRSFFIKKFSEIKLQRDIPNCHDLKSKILKAYYRVRVNIKTGVNLRLSKLSSQNKSYSSRS